MIKPPADLRQIYSVTKLNRYVKSILEGEIGTLWLSAEISNFTAAASGHWYFTLKDSKAQIKCAMFRGANARINYRPKEGDKVLVRGNLSLYEPRGDYQLITEYMELDGTGSLQAAFEALKLKLNGLGLFSQQRKRPLPDVIRTVGVVTSASGAALHDILTVLKRRSPATRVILYPTQVQGERAHQEIINAIDIANQRAEVDVLIVGRGGGSLEDLWCFNHEQLAHCIAASALPIISAVGHEVDITIADLVADLRAPTPSAAAELVSQDQREQRQLLESYQRQLVHHIQRYLSQAKVHLNIQWRGVQRNHPKSKLNTQLQRLDELQQRLNNQVVRQVRQQRQRSEHLSQRLFRVSPQIAIRQHQSVINAMQERLQRALSASLFRAEQQLNQNAGKLHSLSPLATLSRGFSITYKNGKPLHSVADVAVGDTLETQLENGSINSQVMQIER
ncbi:exodeoxyribonuclease VII large subunit [Alteromonas flava]|uniref:exodeoxyribonuclease VII large subunit n=1 Tax=Alteromonas flava TaxID=2048003 RepID=UPI000C2884B9